MQRSYHILGRSDSRSSRKLAAYLARHGQFLLPWVELIEQSRLAVDELIDVVGRAAIEAVLELSAAQVAGPRRQGRRRRGVGWYGRQRGRVRLKERKLAVHRPRLRRPGRGAGKEVPLPTYEAMQEGEGLGARMLAGISFLAFRRLKIYTHLRPSEYNVFSERTISSERPFRDPLKPSNQHPNPGWLSTIDATQALNRSAGVSNSSV